MPVVFEANQGQLAPKYCYRFHRDGADTFFARNGLDILQGHGDEPLHIDFVGGSSIPKGKQTLAGHANYLLGNDASKWIRDISLSSAVEYAELYRGISFDFYGNDQELEHDFLVSPGGRSSIPPARR